MLIESDVAAISQMIFAVIYKLRCRLISVKFEPTSDLRSKHTRFDLNGCLELPAGTCNSDSIDTDADQRSVSLLPPVSLRVRRRTDLDAPLNQFRIFSIDWFIDLMHRLQNCYMD